MKLANVSFTEVGGEAADERAVIGDLSEDVREVVGNEAGEIPRYARNGGLEEKARPLHAPSEYYSSGDGENRTSAGGESLRLTRLELRDFRNYDRFELSSVGDLTLFVGNNGVGKTNLLEAISYLTAGSSFRSGQLSQVIREGCEIAHVSGQLSDGNRELSVELALETGKKKFTVNGKARAQADVRGTLPAIVFTPDDLELAKKSGAVKRDALDSLGGQLARNYYIVKRDFEKAVRYKNRLFRDEASDGLIQSLDETLVRCGAQLFCYRVALFSRLLPLMARNYDLIAQESGALTARYVPSWERLSDSEQELELGIPPDRDKVREIMQESLAAHAFEERRRGRALIGPHADAISLRLSGRDVSAYASQGQQRSVVLAWKLAEVELTQDICGVSPVLLLDDVMSELDARRREMLVRFVSEDTQTFITATDLAGFGDDLLERARVVRCGG